MFQWILLANTILGIIGRFLRFVINTIVSFIVIAVKALHDDLHWMREKNTLNVLILALAFLALLVSINVYEVMQVSHVRAALVNEGIKPVVHDLPPLLPRLSEVTPTPALPVTAHIDYDVLSSAYPIAQAIDEGTKQVQHTLSPVAMKLYDAPALDLASIPCKEQNIRVALESSPGLREIVIKPLTDWSFLEHWNLDAPYVDCGVPAGGTCSIAAEISNVGRSLGMDWNSVDHNLIYEPLLPKEDNIAIWQTFDANSQDLRLGNNTPYTFHITTGINELNQLVSHGELLQ